MYYILVNVFSELDTKLDEVHFTIRKFHSNNVFQIARHFYIEVENIAGVFESEEEAVKYRDGLVRGYIPASDTESKTVI